MAAHTQSIQILDPCPEESPEVRGTSAALLPWRIARRGGFGRSSTPSGESRRGGSRRVHR